MLKLGLPISQSGKKVIHPPYKFTHAQGNLYEMPVREKETKDETGLSTAGHAES